MNMKTWKVRFQEVNERKGETKYTGYLDREGVIEFFGLDRTDIMWYEVTEMEGDV